MPSPRPSGSVVISDCPDCQYSVPVVVWITFGQFARAVQRARMPSLAPVNGIGLRFIGERESSRRERT